MMVITSEVATRYFATPKSIDDFNPNFVFHWANKKNQPVNHWEDVIDQFLMIPMAHQMVGDYLVIDHPRDEEIDGICFYVLIKYMPFVLLSRRLIRVLTVMEYPPMVGLSGIQPALVKL